MPGELSSLPHLYDALHDAPTTRAVRRSKFDLARELGYQEFKDVKGGSQKGLLLSQKEGFHTFLNNESKPEVLLGGAAPRPTLRSIVDAKPGPGGPTVAEQTAADNAIRLLDNLKQIQRDHFDRTQREILNGLNAIVAPVKGQRADLTTEKQQIAELKTKHLQLLKHERAEQIKLFNESWPSIWRNLNLSGAYGVPAAHAAAAPPHPNAQDEATLKVKYIEAIHTEFNNKEQAAEQQYNSYDQRYKTAEAKTLDDAVVLYLWNKFKLKLSDEEKIAIAAGAVVVGGGESEKMIAKKKEILLKKAEDGELTIPSGWFGSDSITVVEREDGKKLQFKTKDITKDSAITILMLWKLHNPGKDTITLSLKSKEPSTDEINALRILAKTARANGIKVKWPYDDRFTEQDEKDINLARKANLEMQQNDSKRETNNALGTTWAFNDLNIKANSVQELTKEIGNLTEKIREKLAKAVGARTPVEEQELADLLIQHRDKTDKLLATLSAYQGAQAGLRTNPYFAHLSPEQHAQFYREQQMHMEVTTDCIQKVYSGIPGAGAGLATDGYLTQLRDLINNERGARAAHFGAAAADAFSQNWAHAYLNANDQRGAFNYREFAADDEQKAVVAPPAPLTPRLF